MKKALVFYLYGTINAGDMAICVGTIELLKSQGYDEISMVSRFSEAENEYEISKKYIEEYYPEVKVYSGPFSFERNFSKLKKLICYVKSYMTICGIVSDVQTIKLIEETDVVFFNGGNLLRGTSTTDYLRLMALFYPIEHARKAKKNIYCLPQSTALISKRGEKILHWYLKSFDKIYIRETISYKTLKERFPDLPFVQSTDLAFLIKDTILAEQKFKTQYKLSKKQKIGLIFRNTGIGDIGFLEQDVQEKIQRCLNEFINSHYEYEYWIIIQNKNDIDFSEIVYEQMKDQYDVRITENHDPLVLREIYKHMDYIVTMRLHAGILALSALTPVVGLFSEIWGLKNPGIMRDYGMPYIIVEQEGKTLNEEIIKIKQYPKSRIADKINQNKIALDGLGKVDEE